MNGGADPTRVPFDHYERYRLTATIASILRQEDAARWRILDVGGHFGTLKLLLPDDHIVIADPKAPPEFAYRESVPFACDAYARAAGGSLPFRDEAFDLVCAHDTLEHVPPVDRERFLVDAARATGRFLVLNGPILSDEAVAAEQRIARMWVEGLGARTHALDEHLQLGLPSQEFVENVLDSLGMPYVVIPNGQVFVWLAMMALKSFLQGLPDSEAAHAALDRAFNMTLAAGDLGGPSYRLAFVAAKVPGDRPLVDRVREALGIAAASSPAESGGTAVHEFVNALQEHVVRVRGIIAELQGDVERLNELARGQARRIEDLDRSLRELQARFGPQA
jgi:hypothetical protein